MVDRGREERGLDAAGGGMQDEQHRVSDRPGDRGRTPVGRAGTLAEAECAAAERNQTASDSDQTAADSEQTASDTDQIASESDQAASDSDQLASDRDFVRGGDSATHRFSRQLRDRSTAQRRLNAAARLKLRPRADAAAQARDLAAAARDQAATARDQAAAQRDRLLAPGDDLASDDPDAAGRRAAAVADRAAAAEARARAAADREQAPARDRLQRARGPRGAGARAGARRDGRADRARMRAAGLADLDAEIDRAIRTGTVLIVAYVDVVALKAVNDDRGHAAGDALLQRVVHEVRHHLRPYDLIVRVGGDEFLCVMPGATDESVHQRFAAVQAALAGEPDPCEIKAGFATLGSGDSAAELIARADGNMPGASRR